MFTFNLLHLDFYLIYHKHLYTLQRSDESIVSLNMLSDFYLKEILFLICSFQCRKVKEYKRILTLSLLSRLFAIIPVYANVLSSVFIQTSVFLLQIYKLHGGDGQ